METRVLKSSFSGMKCAKKERKLLEKSSTSYLGAGCREFESRHLDHKSRKSICSLGFYLLMERLEQSNAARMSTAGEGLTEPILYLRLLAQMQTSLATWSKGRFATWTFCVAECGQVFPLAKKPSFSLQKRWLSAFCVTFLLIVVNFWHTLLS